MLPHVKINVDVFLYLAALSDESLVTIVVTSTDLQIKLGVNIPYRHVPG